MAMMDKKVYIGRDLASVANLCPRHRRKQR